MSINFVNDMRMNIIKLNSPTRKTMTDAQTDRQTDRQRKKGKEGGEGTKERKESE